MEVARLCVCVRERAMHWLAAASVCERNATWPARNRESRLAGWLAGWLQT